MHLYIDMYISNNKFIYMYTYVRIYAGIPVFICWCIYTFSFKCL